MLHERTKRALVEARADSARVFQTALLIVVTDEEGAEALSGTRGVRISTNDKLIVLHALHLEPVKPAPGPVRLIASFRDDPFELHLAYMLEDLRAVSFKMFGEM